MHGMPSISGTSGFAAVVVKPCGERGTRNGVHVVVNVSCSSPVWHWASGAPGSGADNTETVGTAAAATMKPPISSRCRNEREEVAIPRV